MIHINICQALVNLSAGPDLVDIEPTATVKLSSEMDRDIKVYGPCRRSHPLVFKSPFSCLRRDFLAVDEGDRAGSADCSVRMTRELANHLLVQINKIRDCNLTLSFVPLPFSYAWPFYFFSVVYLRVDVLAFSVAAL
jgi:hypothetical protein